ncbi:hypothetical protein C8F01DRAFT_768394 [Mycena amicta]|nr:hypothetical protein C8F01DRAFT_768394 [Mycena amicta]
MHLLVVFLRTFALRLLPIHASSRCRAPASWSSTPFSRYHLPPSLVSRRRPSLLAMCSSSADDLPRQYIAPTLHAQQPPALGSAPSRALAGRLWRPARWCYGADGVVARRISPLLVVVVRSRAVFVVLPSSSGRWLVLVCGSAFCSFVAEAPSHSAIPQHILCSAAGDAWLVLGASSRTNGWRRAGNALVS